MNKYDNGKIYTIRCRLDDDLIYVGSTIQPLYKRWHGHKTKSQNDEFKHRHLYNKINELGIENFYIELYENFNCLSKEELNQREGEITRQIGTLNKYIAGRTQKEYTKDNVEKISETKKQYYENNKEKIKNKMNEYYGKNKEKIKNRTNEYYEKNKEKKKNIMKKIKKK